MGWHWKHFWHEHGFDDAVDNCSDLLSVSPARFISMITRTSSMYASWRVGVWPPSWLQSFKVLRAALVFPFQRDLEMPEGYEMLGSLQLQAVGISDAIMEM